MSIEQAEQIWRAVGVYGIAGLLFGIFYLILALRRMDPNAAESPLRVKILILPGIIALWPILLLQWLVSSGDEGPS